MLNFKFLMAAAAAICIWMPSHVLAQYQMNGNATQTSCNCYQLTQDLQYQGGSVWNANLFNLNNPFTFTFDVYLGCVDAWTADGIAFVLQPVSTNAGVAGGSLGYGGIVPSLVVELDVWENSGGTVNDPAVIDHIAIMQNGDPNHLSANNLAGPVQASSTNANIEDCAWHTIQIIWQPGANTLAVFFDGVFRTSYTDNIITSIFGGNPNVYWGWTGATGSLSQEQHFCNTIRPQFSFPANICEDTPTTLTNTSVTSTGNISSYAWNFGDGGTSTLASPTHTWAAPGNYNVTLTITSEGCTGDTIIPVTVNPAPTVNLGADVNVCTGANIQLNNPNTLGAGTYAWTPAAGLNNAATASPVCTPLANSTYTLTFTTAGGCSSTDNINVNLIAPPNASAGNDATVCQTFSTTLQATGGISYAWSPAAGLSATNVAAPVATPAATTIYTVTATDANNCSATDNVTVNVVTAPAINAGTDVTICEGGSATFNAIGTGTLVWSPATGLDNPNIVGPTATPLVTTTYTVTITDASGCTNTDDLLMTVTPAPVASFTANIACSGNPTQFTSTSSGSIALYNWDFGDGTLGVGANPQQNYANVGSYNVTLTVTGTGGCTDAFTGPVDVITGPIAAFSMQGGFDFCADETISFVNSSLGPIATYAWDFGDNAANPPLPNSTSTLVAPQFSYASFNTYTVTLVVGTADGCFSQAQQILNVHPVPVASFTAPSVCQGQAAQMVDGSAVAVGTVANYTWDFGDGSSTGNGANQSHAYAQPGQYSVTLIAISDMNCSDTITNPVQVNVTPVVSIAATNVCEGLPSVFTNTSTPNNATITSWNWAYGDGTNNAVQVQDYTYATIGTFPITLTAVTDSGCTATGSTTATVYPYPVPAFSISDSIGCAPFDVAFVDLTSIATGTISQITWDLGDGTTSNAGGSLDHTYPNDGLYTISLTAVGSGGGCSSTITMTDLVEVLVTPNAAFTFTPTDATMLDPRIYFHDQSTDAATYMWTFGEGALSNETDPMYTYNMDGTYPVTLLVSNGPCTSTARAEVVIKPEAAFYVPSAFSPNNDGVNERFQVKGMGLQSYVIQVFDRWGSPLFYTTDNELGWDGNFEGKPLPEDIYNYRINVMDVLGREHEALGKVALIR